VIKKSAYSLVLYKDGSAVKKYRIAVGRNIGDKQRVGDMRTPEGEIPIVQIQNASSWTHDFGDGKGQIKGAYGPYFIRLGTPGWTGIGIHGTHAPGSIGSNITEGCVRLNNSDLLELRGMVSIGDKVIIEN
jgi:lipoprotein-anchoring transpeptidase ErfK/SrfK